jgi:hypothetical protein
MAMYIFHSTSNRINSFQIHTSKIELSTNLKMEQFIAANGEASTERVTEFKFGLTALNIWAIGRTIWLTDRVYSIMRMAIFMRVIGLKIKPMALEFISTLMEPGMKATG